MNQNTIQERELLNDDRISRFMQGEMGADEEIAFLEELKNNKDLRNQAIVQARLVKGMKQVDEELKDVFHQSDEQTIKRIAKDASVRKKSSARWFAIAASVVFIVFIGYRSYDYYNITSLGREYANTFPTATIIRGEANTDVEAELSSLFKNVAVGNELRKTTARLASLWDLAKQDIYNDYTDYAPYIGWNLAIGYLEDYEKAKAKAVLNEMKQVYPDSTAIGSKVIILLDAM